MFKRKKQKHDEDGWGDSIYLLLRTNSRRRISRVIMYGFLTASAVASLFGPSALLLEQTGSVFGIIWTLLFGVAALCCFIGSLLDRWVAEYVFIPMLFAAITVFAMILAVQSTTADAGLRLLPYTALFFAFSFGLAARWRDVQALLKISTQVREGEE